MPPSRHCYLVLLFLLSTGCSSTNNNALPPEAQTLVGVDPSDFMATGACGVTVMRYVATLRDVSGSDNAINAQLRAQLITSGISAVPFVVASSPPTPCDEAIVFGNVVSYHAYDAELDGYDRSDIKPPYTGSSAMLAEGEYVAPRWTASCHGWTDGDGGVQPAYSSPYMTVYLRDCTRLGTP